MNRAATFASLIALAVASFPGAAAARTYDVVIDRLKFGPLPSVLKRGDTIRWTNRDLFRHSVSARDGSFDLDLPAGKSGTIVLKRAGRIGYFCKYHPGMTGALLVRR
jgi:plastocyanin